VTTAIFKNSDTNYLNAPSLGPRKWNSRNGAAPGEGATGTPPAPTRAHSPASGVNYTTDFRRVGHDKLVHDELEGGRLLGSGGVGAGDGDDIGAGGCARIRLLGGSGCDIVVAGGELTDGEDEEHER
jgi:hypothetical protein